VLVSSLVNEVGTLGTVAATNVKADVSDPSPITFLA
jgi:hypothetical protein